ncbi:aldehyde dehydrogenase, cytosolic 2-like [Oppia nitens]|uniref:aldehyde dehydrogenase, cytosolic 2-like n=1 Tax=Oppia nitens TaxID=1686743 RepID=UPI0023DCC1D8|nr:aldehyde dehydrogenase, cytosolic 2-like [Oppia nitens]
MASLILEVVRLCQTAGRALAEHRCGIQFFNGSTRAKLANKLVVLGNLYDPLTKFGPLIDGRQYEKVMSMIETGVREGARLMTGGKRWVIDRTNNSDYGLNAGVFTDDINKALVVASELQVGKVAINMHSSFECRCRLAVANNQDLAEYSVKTVYKSISKSNR